MLLYRYKERVHHLVLAEFRTKCNCMEIADTNYLFLVCALVFAFPFGMARKERLPRFTTSLQLSSMAKIGSFKTQVLVESLNHLTHVTGLNIIAGELSSHFLDIVFEIQRKKSEFQCNNRGVL